MKLKDLKESVDSSKEIDDAKVWISKHARPMLAGDDYGLEVKYENGKITWSVNDDIDLVGDFTEIPYQLTKCKLLQLRTPNLTSFKNFPEIIDGRFSITGKCNEISSFEGAPKIIKDDLSILSGDFSNLTSLKDIHKHIHEVHGNIDLRYGIRSNVLGLMKIKHVKSFSRTADSAGSNIDKVVKILNQFYKEGNAGIIKAQRNLLDLDLDDYAEF